jgi:hypothetical protein
MMQEEAIMELLGYKKMVYSNYVKEGCVYWRYTIWERDGKEYKPSGGKDGK